MSREARLHEFTAALAAICANCTGLQSLQLLHFDMVESALHELSTLRQLRHLTVQCRQEDLGPAAGAALATMPQLQSLGLRCRSLSSSGVQAQPATDSRPVLIACGAVPCPLPLPLSSHMIHHTPHCWPHACPQCSPL
jgi:hypothetical protein